MTNHAQPLSERLFELLADRALHGLSAAEETALKAEMAAAGLKEEDSFDLAAAAAELAFSADLTATPPLPHALSAKIALDALQHVPHPIPRQTSIKNRFFTWRDAGWLVVAASLTGIAAIWGVSQNKPVSIAITPPKSPTELRQELVSGAGELVQVSWDRGADATATNASGDVVWSPSKQQGYMRFSGLQPNDPAQNQYQLWIFDEAQDARYPIDGGVFNIPASAGTAGEIIVPITAKLPVSKVTLFAVTIEKPGGVVVSSRERLPLLAKVTK